MRAHDNFCGNAPVNCDDYNSYGGREGPWMRKQCLDNVTSGIYKQISIELEVSHIKSTGNHVSWAWANLSIAQGVGG